MNIRPCRYLHHAFDVDKKYFKSEYWQKDGVVVGVLRHQFAAIGFGRHQRGHASGLGTRTSAAGFDAVGYTSGSGLALTHFMNVLIQTAAQTPHPHPLQSPTAA